jgi:hypothetical protein
MVMDPVGAQFPVTGSYNSAEDNPVTPLDPPATKTLPSFKVVNVVTDRGPLIGAVDVQVKLLELKTSVPAIGEAP